MESEGISVLLLSLKGGHMTNTPQTELSPDTKRMLGMDGIILGYLLGASLILYGGMAFWKGEHLISSPVGETLWVAIYLTAVVAYCGFKMPVFMAHSPLWSTFWLIVFCGHISLLFDSFAVVLLLATGIVFTPLPNQKNQYNQFVVRVTAAFCALTVGGAFYLGELWGLPYYITNGLDNWKAGFPLLIVLTPYCLLIALLVALTHPVKMEPVEFDTAQKLAGIEFTIALLLIILTHSVFLCLGVLLFYTALRKNTAHLVTKTAHEITDGAQNALGLILLAVVIQAIGWSGVIQQFLVGAGLFVGAAISSPFAGAMAPAAVDLQSFYEGLILIMLGAPLFVFSSLVAIVVFKESIDYEDLPAYMKPVAALIGGKRRGHIQEGIAYTFLVTPLLLGLAASLYFASANGIFTKAAAVLGVEFPVKVTKGTDTH